MKYLLILLMCTTLAHAQEITVYTSVDSNATAYTSQPISQADLTVTIEGACYKNRVAGTTIWFKPDPAMVFTQTSVCEITLHNDSSYHYWNENMNESIVMPVAILTSGNYDIVTENRRMMHQVISQGIKSIRFVTDDGNVTVTLDHATSKSISRMISHINHLVNECYE